MFIIILIIDIKMGFTKIVIASVISLFAISTRAWDNTPPIPERHPGWSDGKGQ
jgi:hypothetical protein